MSHYDYDFKSFYNPPALEAGPTVSLAGVPTIPADCHRTMTELGEAGLTAAQMARCDVAIWEHATPEIQRRKRAKRLGSHAAASFADDRFSSDEE